MHVVRTIEELDRKIAECDAAEAISDDAMRALFGTFRMEEPGDIPTDPYSSQYRLRQLQIYKEITGEVYSTAKEATKFDVASALRRPFPFNTNSCATAGEYFMAIGYVLKAMTLPAGSRVLEFGPGWGFSSLWLAHLGHHVTVVEIEPCFCELIKQRAAGEGVSIEVINSDFFWVEGQAREFDAVLFYDCFHHCDDHARLLRALGSVVLPGGRVFFGAEPITPEFPLPWGLRLDGWSLWGIRKNGWMELGFRDDYFTGILARCGWFGRKIAVSGVDRLRVWEARHLSEAVFRFLAGDSDLQTQVGDRRDDVIVLDRVAKGTGLYGPYVDIPAGRYIGRIKFLNGSVTSGHAMMDIACRNGQKQLASGSLDKLILVERPFVAELIFASDAEMNGVEVRLFCERGFSAIVDSVEIVPLGKNGNGACEP
ncbi:MAG TPA: class I SAM-dependent methyltransferase [Rhizomicrobium sp.]